MIKMIRKDTGTVMYVHESRVEEYKAAGHSLAAPPVKKSRKKKED